jgi:hypothetical protein
MVIVCFTSASTGWGLMGLEKRRRHALNLRNPNSGSESELGKRWERLEMFENIKRRARI